MYYGAMRASLLLTAYPQLRMSDIFSVSEIFAKLLVVLKISLAKFLLHDVHSTLDLTNLNFVGKIMSSI